MTNKKINLDTDFLDEDDDKTTKKQEDPNITEIFSEFFQGKNNKSTPKSKQEDTKNDKPYKYLGDKKGIYYEDDGYDEGRNWQKYSRDTSSNKSPSKDTTKKYGFRHIFGGLFILVVVIALFGGFDDSPKPVTSPSNYKIDTGKMDFSKKDTTTTSNTTTNNSNEDEVITGQFSCSSYNHDEAGRLSPSTTKKAELDSKEADLNTMDSGIDEMEGEINSFRLNKSSQYSVNTDNEKIDTYNSLISKRKVKYTEYKNLLDSYNASVDKYNSFLEKNCTRRY